MNLKGERRILFFFPLQIANVIENQKNLLKGDTRDARVITPLFVALHGLSVHYTMKIAPPDHLIRMGLGRFTARSLRGDMSEYEGIVRANDDVDFIINLDIASSKSEIPGLCDEECFPSQRPEGFADLFLCGTNCLGAPLQV